jgi:hypothetical protein
MECDGRRVLWIDLLAADTDLVGVEIEREDSRRIVRA